MSSITAESISRLIQSGNYTLAEREIKGALSQDPEDSSLHGWLALCYLEMGQPSDSLQEAILGLQADPDDMFCLYICAHAHLHLEQYAKALDLSEAGLKNAPFSKGWYILRGRVFIAQRKWQNALDTITEGLELDPEDTDLHNMHQVVLRRLGRSGDALESVQDNLRRNPEDSFSHANLGWTCLEAEDNEAAVNHFRESLRLNPHENEYAREGLLHALKGKYWIYRKFLRVQVKLATIGQKNLIFGILAFIFIIDPIIVSALSSTPATSALLMPFNAFVIFGAMFLWVPRWFFNAALLFHPLGQLALKPREKILSLLFFFVVLASICFYCLGEYTSLYIHTSLFILCLALLVSMDDFEEKGLQGRKGFRKLIVSTVVLLKITAVAMFLLSSPWTCFFNDSALFLFLSLLLL